jgi:hypothetical protein
MAEIKKKKPTVPKQRAGAKKDIEHVVENTDNDSARKLFMIARNRLVNVNQWHEYATGISAAFRLCDQNGDEVNRTAEKGDYFKIDLPGPGSNEGKGFDWARIEKIEDRSDSTGDQEYIGIRVRPTSNPKEKGEDIAHFFKDDSTSSFVIERRGKLVTAAVYGRNEKPNIQTHNVVDKIRNAVIGATAILGFSNLQWKNLVKGLLKTN